ncbi:MAG: hypothetical protein J5I90_17995 [Caldilineales bacterium]|nr:hypothetical protein [Caldilineales bacterium]
MNDQPDRITPFLRGFNVEDLILYVFSVILIAVFALFFYQHYTKTVQPEAESVLASDWLTPSGSDICTDYVKAQVTNIAYRYQQARIATATNAVRRSLGFLIGTIGFLLGCIIVIRGVRNSPIEAEASASESMRLKVVTSSPGLLIVILSTIILLSVMFLDDKVEVTDGGITLPVCEQVQQPTSLSEADLLKK